MARPDEMADFDDVALLLPESGKQIRDEAAMAFFRSGFGTEKCEPGKPRGRVQICGDTATSHRRKKICFIRRPIFRAAIDLEKLRRWSEQRLMQVLDSGDFIEEEGEVRVLGKSRELAAAVLPDVNDLLDASVRKQRKELLGCFSCEADGAEETLHRIQKNSAASGEARKAKSFDWSTKAS